MSENRGIPGNVTELLQSWAVGDPGALDRAVPQIYSELRNLAKAQLRGRPSDATLSAPALVNEVYLRLSHMSPVPCENRSRFLALARTMMRGVLVDYYRARHARKRGGPAIAVTLTGVAAKTGIESNPAVLDVAAALKDLVLVNELHAKIVERRYFGGLSIEEIAESLDLSPSKVKRDWLLARAWMKQRLTQRPTAASAARERGTEIVDVRPRQ
jgi:RNA polymerase sigma factor (TIGR02999 family)